jgi:hypothetical protein
MRLGEAPAGGKWERLSLTHTQMPDPTIQRTNSVEDVVERVACLAVHFDDIV